MRSSRIRRRSGRRSTDLLAVLTLAVGLVGCNYGFEGGGFPSHIQTIYIAPFENQTPQFDLEQQLFARLLEELPSKLGLRPAGEGSADAVLRGEIRRYEDAAQNYRPGAGDQPVGNVLTHEVQIGISAELVDVRDNVIRWETSSLVGRGTYRPDTETDEVAQREAIQNLIDQIINGAQSQW